MKTMPGYPLTESVTSRWHRFVGAVGLRMLVANAAVGVLAGLAIAHVRLHLGMPGHKVLLWLTPIVAARLLARHPLGAATGALAAACVSLGLGGRFAGGILLLPLIGVAGAVFDGFILFAEKRQLHGWLVVLLAGAGGLAASLVVVLKRILLPQFRTHIVLGVSGPPAQILSYAFFGLLAGLVGAAAAVAVRTIRRKRSNA